MIDRRFQFKVGLQLLWLLIGCCALIALFFPSMPISVQATQYYENITDQSESVVTTRNSDVALTTRNSDVAMAAQSNRLNGVDEVRGQQDSPDIVGGEEAIPGAWPWMAALITDPDGEGPQINQYCGGALIAPQWILTAGHCVSDIHHTRIEVILGRHALSADDEGERVKIRQHIVHPNFDERSLDFDLALVELIQPSLLPTMTLISPNQSNLVEVGTVSTAIGWGLTDSSNLAGEDRLRQVDLPIVSNESCNAPAVYNGRVTNNMFCAGYPEGGRDACARDSGGPLVVPNADGTGWLQAGIVSWGTGCARAGKFGVYTQLLLFNNWIQETMVRGGPAPVDTPEPTPTPGPTAIPTPTPVIEPTPDLGPVIRIDDYTVIPGEPITVVVESLGLSNLGVATIDIVYDPDVLEPILCTPDPDGGFSLSQCNTEFNDEGIRSVRFNLISPFGTSGDHIMAIISFDTFEGVETSSTLDIMIETIADIDGASVNVVEDDGSVEVTEIVLGDVNCDGERTAVDGLFILQHEIGMRLASSTCVAGISNTLFTPACDVSGDSDCGAVDALFILQCDVNFPNSLCPAPGGY